MEETKIHNSSNKSTEERNIGINCPWWIFGDKNSADNDLKEKFEVVDEENQDNA